VFDRDRLINQLIAYFTRGVGFQVSHLFPRHTYSLYNNKMNKQKEKESVDVRNRKGREEGEDPGKDGKRK